MMHTKEREIRAILTEYRSNTYMPGRVRYRLNRLQREVRVYRKNLKRHMRGVAQYEGRI